MTATNVLRAALLAVALLAAAACGKKSDEGEAPPATPTETAPAPETAKAAPAAPQDAGAAGEGDDVPTAVDYEEQAQNDITDDNLEQQVKDMEEELGVDAK